VIFFVFAAGQGWPSGYFGGENHAQTPIVSPLGKREHAAVGQISSWLCLQIRYGRHDPGWLKIVSKSPLSSQRSTITNLALIPLSRGLFHAETVGASLLGAIALGLRNQITHRERQGAGHDRFMAHWSVNPDFRRALSEIGKPLGGSMERWVACTRIQEISQHDR
jgi:hypothetical protein